MRSILFSAALALTAAGSSAFAQQARPAPYTPLLFNPHANHWAFRAEGVPWLCVQDGRCARLRFERIADDDLPAAAIASLGFADRAFYLAFQHPRYQDGRPHVFRCTADGCAKFELDAGEFVLVGTFSVKQRDRLVGKTAILARHDTDPTRTRLLWCADSGCSEHPLTRDNRYDLTLLGAARFEGRDRVWLREQDGAVLSCAQPDAEADRLDCERTSLVYPEFPADPGALDQHALAAAIEDALRRGNFAEAERLLSEGRARFPGQRQWDQLAQRLAQLRSEREARLRLDQARRLVTEARRYANAGDFAAADTLLQQAARLVPNLAELTQARAELARLRAERERRFRERGEYVAAIEQALAAYRLWEAEYLISEAERRFANDAAFRNYRTRLQQIRAQAEWQRRLRRAREHVAAAHQAMDRGDYGQAERQLDEAEDLAPGLPEIREARADLARERIGAEWRADEIRQLTAAIEAALTRSRFEVAERLLADAMRRHPRHPGWAGLQRRLEQAKRAEQGDRAKAERIQNLVADARAALQRQDLAAAERAVVEAERLDRDAASVKAVRADLEKAKRDAASDRDKAERIQKLVADARAALQRKDLAAAERAVSEAEKLDRDAPAVKAVRADLDKAKREARPRYTEPGLRADIYDRIMAQLGQQGGRYRAATGHKALAYCIDWSKVRADSVPLGPFAMHATPESESAAQTRALAACRERGAQGCTCTLVDVGGRNALRIPPEVIERLNRTP